MADGPVVVVGGAAVTRVYRVEALPLPGETVLTTDEVALGLGGKGANQAVAARRLGAPTCFIGRLGRDEEGHRTEADLREAGVETHLQWDGDLETGHAAVLLDAEGEGQVAIHPGANAALSAEAVIEARSVVRRASVYVAQLEVPADAARAGAVLARDVEALTLLNASPLRPGSEKLFGDFDVVVLERSEAEALAEVGITSLDDALAALRALKDLGVETPIITLGAAGAVMHDRGRGVHVPAPRRAIVDATGAQDAFVGALAAFLRDDEELGDAVAHACACRALAAESGGGRAGYPDREALPRDED